MWTRRRRAAGWIAAVALLAPAPFVAHAGPGEPDCDGPPAEAQPGTAEWDQREADNESCGSQRSRDTQANPAYSAAAARVRAQHGGAVPEDPFRDPDELNGRRFRFEHISFTNADGAARAGMLFRPCDGGCHDRPPGLRDYAPPYPAVLIVHGGAASQEMYLWGAESLAEAGYMVVTFQIPNPENAAGDAHYPDAKAVLDWMLATPASPRPGGGFNPRWAELDREHVGLAGHSAGGVAVSRLGQEDPRVSAIVSWDRAQSQPMPDGLPIRTPALFFAADYLCQKVPVCVPQPFTSPPDPLGPGNKDEDFRRVSAAGVDSMKVTLRAATHLDFTQFSPATGSRYGATVAFYYTLAWFDRYLRGSDPGLARLIATRFDDSADVHNISGGTFDPATGKNVPAHIAGEPVADRLSFEFRSAYFLDSGRYRCASMRAGCPPAAAAEPRHTGAGCAHPRFAPRSVTVRRGRARVRPRIRCAGRELSAPV